MATSLNGKKRKTRGTNENMTKKPHAPDAAPSLSLQNYVSNIFYGVFIQDDDGIALEIYKKNWSRSIQEVDNGAPLNFNGFLHFLLTTRKTVTDRYLVSQSAVVAPRDEEGRTGQVAHTSHWTAVQEGKPINGTIVSVLKIGMENGRRMVETESFVLSVTGA